MADDIDRLRDYLSLKSISVIGHSNGGSIALDYAERYPDRDLILTPALHVGRINELTNGVTVGHKLGSSPPTLPTAMHFTPKFGFALTYRLPFL